MIKIVSILGMLLALLSVIAIANTHFKSPNNKNQRLWDYVTAAGTTNYYDTKGYPPTETRSTFPSGTYKVSVFYGIKMVEPNGALAIYEWKFNGKIQGRFEKPIQNGYNYLEIYSANQLPDGEHEVMIYMDTGQPLAKVFFIIGED